MRLPKLRFSLRSILEAIFVLAVLLTMWRIYHPSGIRPGETLEIRALGTLLDQPIDGVYKVDEAGKVPLGAGYGSVYVAGLGTEAAGEAIATHLKKILKAPDVSVTRTADDRLLQLQAANRKLRSENEQLKERLSGYESAHRKTRSN